MTTNILLTVLAFVVLLSRLRSLIKWRSRARGRPLPPGPKRLPVIGNMFTMPTWKPWVGFRDLIDRFGDMVYLEVLGRPILVLGKPAVMSEFLEKRSATTSDRVETALIPLVGQDYNFAFMRYGHSWRIRRRVFWQQFNSNAVSTYWPVQQAITRDFLLKLLEKPTQYQVLIRFVFSAVALKAIYGVDVKDEQDELISIIDSIFVGLRQVTVSAQFLLEFLPALRHLPTWIPGTAFLKRLAASRVSNDHILHTEFAKAKARVNSGEDRSSVVSKLINRLAVSGSRDTMDESVVYSDQNEVLAKDVAAVAVEAGADTTFSTMEALLLAMSLHPEVQSKAHAELQAVVGSHRLPQFDDRKELVYINAIVKEITRWHNVLPLGVGHFTTEDEELRGCFIPAGTTVIPNVWAVAHDPEIYPEPNRFYPERFIRDGKLDFTHAPDPLPLAFGFGRRVCPGRYFADSIIFIMIASILHVFDIGPPLDENGLPIKVKLEQSHGFLSYPEDCRLTVKPRSPGAEALIRASIPEVVA